MSHKVSQNVLVKVHTTYVPEFCDDQFFFRYSITITNQNLDAVMLKSRHWEIVDVLSDHRVVDGLGVVGEQPVLAKGESFTYTSGVVLEHPIGSMAGHFDFQNLHTGKSFEVEIPSFILEANFVTN